MDPQIESQKKPLRSSSKWLGRATGEGESAIKELFHKLGGHYLERTIFADEGAVFRENKLTDSAEDMKNPKVSDEKFEEYSDLVRNGDKAPIFIKWTSDDVGYGIFASEDIPAGTLIAEYAGMGSPKSHIKNRTWSWKYPIKGPVIDSFPNRVSLDGGIHGNEIRFINHSDNRNTSPVLVHNGTNWVNCYHARKAITKDEELFISDGKRYWKTRVKVDL